MASSHEAPSHALAWRLAGPIILANISGPLLGAVDTAVMGHLPDPAYLGGVAIGSVIFLYIYWGFGFLRMGTTGLVAQAFGADDGGEVRAILLRALLIAASIGATLWALQIPIFAVARAIFQARPEVESFAHTYFAVRVWSAPAALANYCLIGWFIGVRETRSALVLQVGMNGLNIALALLFVMGLGWGVAGVATATMISEYAAAGIGLFLYRRLAPAGATAAVLDRVRLKRLFGLNFDIFVRTFCLISAFAIFTREGAAFGTATLAANQVLLQFQAFMAFGLDGFAQAAEAMVGGALGAHDRGALRRSIRITGEWAAGLAILISAAYALAGPQIVSVLTDIDEVRSQAARYLPWLIASPIVSVWSFMLDGIFIGATRGREMRNAMIASFGIYLIALWLAKSVYADQGLWLAFLLFLGARAVTLALFYPRIERAAA